MRLQKFCMFMKDMVQQTLSRKQKQKEFNVNNTQNVPRLDSDEMYRMKSEISEEHGTIPSNDKEATTNLILLYQSLKLHEVNIVEKLYQSQSYTVVSKLYQSQSYTVVSKLYQSQSYTVKSYTVVSKRRRQESEYETAEVLYVYEGYSPTNIIPKTETKAFNGNNTQNVPRLDSDEMYRMKSEISEEHGTIPSNDNEATTSSANK
ncbi:hypothetical protein CEXT_565561 [Caerostris extrusa]|uniref:Uncharacterized protein n=1 Tax=Caerostris extrusa TaxID=172846 RepID=A0AAV4M6W0_CAEEX|nr:hypothetical protein CEXT_565561 [Caerostris extrusa]